VVFWLILIGAATVVYKWRGNDWWMALAKAAATVYGAYFAVLALAWLVNR
jgi:hypothetical protein